MRRWCHAARVPGLKGRLLDAISSWWVITHGHRHPRIIEAIKRQADELDQVIFAGFTHQPAEDLARALIGIAPRGLAHVFYSDSGSTAVEVALKMALGFWKNQNKPRTRIIALEHAYHGDTVGTMSAGARGVYNAAYDPLLFDVVRLPFPQAGREQQTLDMLKAAAPDAAALIVEPLILGAGGMFLYPPEVLRALAIICRRNGALFIADEVMTGFGRTGSLFACQRAGVVPDLICLSKGLTGGFLPLAATVCRDELYQAFLGGGFDRAFAHGHSFTANPLGCAAALASLDLIEAPETASRIKAIERRHRAWIQRLADHPHLRRPRALGTIAAVDLDTEELGYGAAVAPRLKAFFLDRGLLIRPLGPVIYLLPPLCISDQQLDRAYQAIEEAALALRDTSP